MTLLRIQFFGLYLYFSSCVCCHGVVQQYYLKFSLSFVTISCQFVPGFRLFFFADQDLASVPVEVFLPDISFQTGPKIIIVGFYQKIFKGCFLPDTSFQTRKVGSSQPDKTLSGRFHPKIFILMDSSRHLSWLFNPIFSFGGSLQTTNIPHPMS